MKKILLKKFSINIILLFLLLRIPYGCNEVKLVKSNPFNDKGSDSYIIFYVENSNLYINKYKDKEDFSFNGRIITFIFVINFFIFSLVFSRYKSIYFKNFIQDLRKMIRRLIIIRFEGSFYKISNLFS